MSYYKLLFLICGLSGQVFAANYSDQKIQNVIDERVNLLTSDFVRGYFTADNPQRYLNVFLSDKASSNGGLIKEYQLYTLLNEIAQYPQLPFLQDAINTLKIYEVQSQKLHEEGRLLIPVYDINNKAQGIENIWLAQKSHHYYIKAFNDAPIQTLLSLRHTLQGMDRPVWEGLKKSIQEITPVNQQHIRYFLLEDQENMIGLDRFISHYVLIVGDQELTKIALNYVNKSAGQHILRYLSQYFSSDFVIDTLLASLAQKKHQGFVISMLAEFVDNSDVVSEVLINMLSEEKYASQAGFALSQSQRPSVMRQLYQRFNNSKNAQEKKSIVYALKLSKHNEAQLLLNRINNKQLDKSTQQWLNHFEGAIR